MKRGVNVGLVMVLFGLGAIAVALHLSRHAPLRVRDTTLQLPADGRFHHVATVAPCDAAKGSATGLPAMILPGKPRQAEIAVRSPVLPQARTIRVSCAGRSAMLRLRWAASAEDSVADGTPDFLRLHTREDRGAFRDWFVALAEAAADLPADRLPHEIGDCAALLRWCYRNALHAHDEAWLRDAPQPLDLSRTSVQQYAWPLTPLGAALFRVRSGAYVPADADDGAFAQFADARTLWQRNTFFLSRDVHAARPGDLLFFRQLEQNSPYHSMIVTGGSQPDVIYHTGPIGRGPGEMRRVLLQDLLQHPDPRWRPVVDNSNFLGVYRWNILGEDPR